MTHEVDIPEQIEAKMYSFLMALHDHGERKVHTGGDLEFGPPKKEIEYEIKVAIREKGDTE